MVHKSLDPENRWACVTPLSLYLFIEAEVAHFANGKKIEDNIITHGNTPTMEKTAVKRLREKEIKKAAAAAVAEQKKDQRATRMVETAAKSQETRKRKAALTDLPPGKSIRARSFPNYWHDPPTK